MPDSSPIGIIETKLKARNRSEQTIKRFKIYAKNYLDWLVETKNKPFHKTNCDDLTEYFSEKEYSGNTKFTMFYAFKTIFDIWKIHWAFGRVDVPKKSSPSRPYFTDDEIHKLIETADKLSSTAASLVRVARDCGCRRVSINKMNRKNFKPSDEPVLIVPDAKGGEPVEMRIGKDTEYALNTMLTKRKDDNEALFVNQLGKRMTLTGLSELFREVKQFSKIDKERAGIHAMRRSKVTRLRNAGMDEFDIVEIMGWKPGTEMVHVYAQLDKKKLQKKGADADPFIGGKEKSEKI